VVEVGGSPEEDGEPLALGKRGDERADPRSSGSRAAPSAASRAPAGARGPTARITIRHTHASSGASPRYEPRRSIALANAS
jgi:hypothetical protein